MYVYRADSRLRLRPATVPRTPLFGGWRRLRSASNSAHGQEGACTGTGSFYTFYVLALAIAARCRVWTGVGVKYMNI